MPKKLDYTYVKKYIEKKQGAKLISTEYINSATPLIIQCKCGNYFKKTFNKCKDKKLMCSKCLKNFLSKKFSLNIEYVKNKIEEKGCKYLDGEYVNSKSKLKILCKCGNVFEKDFNHFKRQPRCPQCGNTSLKQSKTKYNLKYAIDYYKSKNFMLLENEYKGCHVPMKCKCQNGHIQYKKMLDLKQQKNGCNLCVINMHKGENHWNYKGGTNELFDTLRKELKVWKQLVLKDRNYRCELTNSKTNLEVHHLKNFVEIVHETLNELKLPLYRKCNKYNEEELENIKKAFLTKHTLDIGVVLTKKLHKQFHTIYGLHNNTLSQFIEFKNNFLINLD